FVSATNGATYDSGTNTVTFTTGTLATGGTTSFQLTLSVSPGFSGTLANTATVAPPPGVTDPVPGNNSWTDTGTPTPPADLALVPLRPATRQYRRHPLARPRHEHLLHPHGAQ